MKVLFLSTWFPYPPDNGSKIRSNYLLHALAETHEVSLVAFDPDRSTEPVSSDNVTTRPVHADPFRYVRLPQVAKYVSPVPVAFWGISEMESAVQPLHGEQWDAVVAVQAPVARYALEFGGIPRVLDVDTALSYQLRERYQEQPTHAGRLRAWISWYKAYRYERVLFRQFQACALVSPIEVGSLEAMVSGRSNVVVIPNGVDCRRNRPGLEGVTDDTLVYNGALTYSANYDAMRWFLAEIYPLIKARVPNVSMSITGSTRGVDLTGLALDLSVRLTGHVDDVRVPVAQAAVCVVPIRKGGGTRLKILEAMALATPVVATSKGAEGLDVIDGEHLLVGDTPEAFAVAVLRVMKDRALRKRLSRNARSLVERQYDWEMIGAQFVALVEETAKGK